MRQYGRREYAGDWAHASTDRRFDVEGHLLFVFSSFSIMIGVVKFNYCIVISRVHTMIPRHFLKSMHNAHEPFMMNGDNTIRVCLLLGGDSEDKDTVAMLVTYQPTWSLWRQYEAESYEAEPYEFIFVYMRGGPALLGQDLIIDYLRRAI